MKKRVMVVLDESGSMESRLTQTVDAFNEYKSTLDEDARLSVVLFNSNGRRKIAENKPLKAVDDLTTKTYLPGGMTPLIDAVMEAIFIMEIQAKKKDRVVVMVQTDGLENCSREYERRDLAKKIADKTADGWLFQFIGADMDAWKESSKYGFSQGTTMGYGDDIGQTKAAFRVSAEKASVVLRGGARGQSIFTSEDRAEAGETEVLDKLKKQ